ncbi:MAG: hypothetical protein IKA05_08100 [Clostridia bacterium]|nr:hypothetical protein [Clostridia bacterium]
MKILIAYASKYGTAQACAERLESALKGKDVTTVALDRESVDPAAFDTVIFGSSVYFGRMRPSARQFLKTYEQTLLQKRTALFLCCGLEGEYEYYREKFFSKELLAHAFAVMHFGGTLKLEGRSFWDRQILRSIRSSLFEADMDNGEYTPTYPVILPENVDKLASLISTELGRLDNR